MAYPDGGVSGRETRADRQRARLHATCHRQPLLLRPVQLVLHSKGRHPVGVENSQTRPEAETLGNRRLRSHSHRRVNKTGSNRYRSATGGPNRIVAGRAGVGCVVGRRRVAVDGIQVVLVLQTEASRVDYRWVQLSSTPARLSTEAYPDHQGVCVHCVDLGLTPRQQTTQKRNDKQLENIGQRIAWTFPENSTSSSFHSFLDPPPCSL